MQKIAQTYGIKLSAGNPYSALSHLDIASKWDTVRPGTARHATGTARHTTGMAQHALT